MKTLYLARHAKSSWENPDLPDAERPLLEKGKKRTKKMIDYLLNQNVKMDQIISSHAKRALETAKILAHAFHYPLNDIKVDHLIYEGDEQQIANHFFDLPNTVDHIWVIGHNPTITNFANMFLDEKIDQLQTSGVVCIHFDTPYWENIRYSPREVGFISIRKN